MADANELKERLGSRAKEIIAYGIGLKVKRGKACCPFHKEDTPSLSWYEEGLNWKCFGCNETLDIYRYYTEFQHMTFIDAVKEVARLTGGEIELSNAQKQKQYKKPCIKTDELSKEAIEYMGLRKISKETLDDWKVLQRKWNKQDCYVFQYFNEANELEFVSYRGIGKGGIKGGCEPETKPILWGMNHVDITKPVIITEGQPDAMAIWESGYKNVVSVPSGSSNFGWIDNCWNWLETLEEIIIFGDNDDAGLKMVNELITRLGKYRVKVVNHNYKDANEVLFYEGKDVLLKTITTTIKEAPKGIVDMSNFKYTKLKDSMNIGIPTGFYGIDKEIDDMQPEQITVLVGRNGEGKSTILSQMICTAIESKAPVFLYSGELSNNRILRWMYKQAIGKETEYLEYVRRKYKDDWDISDRALKALQQWSDGLFFTYDKSCSNVRKNTDDLFSAMQMAVKRYGCKLIVIDNLMSALEDTADTINADQSNFTQKCKDFAETFNVHVVLAVHPNKSKGEDMNLNKEDISGSNNIPNKADNIIAIQRCYSNERVCDAKLRLLKDREEGNITEVPLFYQKESKRLVSMSANGIVLEPKFSWKQYLEKFSEAEKVTKTEQCPF